VPRNVQESTKLLQCRAGNGQLRLHIDYAGPIQGKMLLVVVEVHSKWMEASIVNSANTAITKRSMFTTHSLPKTVVSDNGSVLPAVNLRISYRRMTAPYHPASNGLAERAVQTLKQVLKKFTDGCLETKPFHFLFQYRIIPHTTTGQTPAQLLIVRCLHSHLDQLLPDLQSHIQDK